MISKHLVDGLRVFLVQPCSVPASGITHTFGTFGTCATVEQTIGASVALFGCVLSSVGLHLELRLWPPTFVSAIRQPVRAHVFCDTRVPCRVCWPLHVSSPACRSMPHMLSQTFALVCHSAKHQFIGSSMTDDAFMSSTNPVKSSIVYEARV